MNINSSEEDINSGQIRYLNESAPLSNNEIPLSSAASQVLNRIPAEDRLKYLVTSKEPELEEARIAYRNRLLSKPVTNKIKVGRNESCPCGSGKKYKKCCLNKNL